MNKKNRERLRFLTRLGFFSLFLLAPPLDIFRLDLTEGHAIIFGMPWTLDFANLQSSDKSAFAIHLMVRVFLPILSVVVLGLVFFWKYGRIYCGWFCPHFSIVEHINAMMLKRLGKPSIWEKSNKAAVGFSQWLVICSVAFLMAFVWAFTLLSYLIDPFPMYAHILNFSLTGGPLIFLCVATALFFMDFVLARHLFCKYGCALGIFQSLLWMANKKALIVSFDSARASLCKDCNSACDKACPMRLPPRSIKRAKFTCTQCTQCISACDQAQKDNPDGRLLHWVTGEEAVKLDRGMRIPLVNKDEDQNMAP